MKKVTTTYFCDRCGAECTEDVGARDVPHFWAGLYEDIRKRLGRAVPHYDEMVYIGVYPCDKSENKLTLCKNCRDSLQNWWWIGVQNED